MAKVLFLAHRLPFPPDKGDKIRSHHLLKRLAAGHQVWLGATCDDAADTDRLAGVDHGCVEAIAPTVGSWRRGLNMLRALVEGGPLSVARFRHPDLERWIARVLSEVQPDLVFVYSSALAQYLPERLPPHTRVVVDFVDADAAKWQAYARSSVPPLSWLFRREARAVVDFEARVLDAASVGILISAAERQVMAGLQPKGAGKLSVITNGVDLDAFRPSPAAEGAPLIVMCGRMDYRANIDGAQWFAREVLPRVRASRPDARFRIVGAAPARAVLALAALPGVDVTGSVPDVRPHLAAAHVVVAPLRVARGIQNKVLEGMAAGRPVVATGGALDGLAAAPGVDVLRADTPAEFAGAVLDVLEGRAPPQLARRARAYVETHHRWDRELLKLDSLVAQVVDGVSGQAAA